MEPVHRSEMGDHCTNQKSEIGPSKQILKYIQLGDTVKPEAIEIWGSAGDIKHIPLTQIYVKSGQVRTYFDPDELEKLKNSIQKNGFQGAILLRPLPADLETKVGNSYKFELIYGESRYRAVKDLGYDTIPSIVRNLTDIEARRIRLDENLIRKNLNPLEEVNGLLEIAADEIGIAPEEVVSLLDGVANATKRKRALTGDIARQADKLQIVLDYYKKGTLSGFRTKYAKLQRLPEDIKEAVKLGEIDWSKAVEIAPVKNAVIRERLLQWVKNRNPSVAEIRRRRKEFAKSGSHGKQQLTNDNATKKRFYKGLAAISESDAWSNPENQGKIENLMREIENIFDAKVF